MYNTDMPTANELPSTAKLIRSTIIASIVALVLLVTVVLPAEYALDPTGASRLLGLTTMGEIKEQLVLNAATQLLPIQSSSDENLTVPIKLISEPAAVPVLEAEPKTQALALTPATEVEWQDEIRVVLTPGKGTEFKLTMDEGAIARFFGHRRAGPLTTTPMATAVACPPPMKKAVKCGKAKARCRPRSTTTTVGSFVIGTIMTSPWCCGPVVIMASENDASSC